MLVAWGKKVDDAFIARVIEMNKRLGFGKLVDEVMSCIAFETAGTFDPRIRNMAGSSGTGLIQFMESTARGLGTTTTALAKMTAVEQLGYVEKYFKPYASRIATLSDLYMAILMPRYIGMPPDTVVFTKGTQAYEMNKGLDIDKSGRIQLREITAKVYAMLEQGKRPQFAREYPVKPVLA